MNSNRFEISNWHENKFCSNEVSFRLHFKTTRYFDVHFISGSVYMYFITRNEISFLAKWPIWNPYRFEFHFTPIYVNTIKELTKHRSEIFNRNETSHQSEFISPLMCNLTTKLKSQALEIRLFLQHKVRKMDFILNIFLWILQNRIGFYKTHPSGCCGIIHLERMQNFSKN